MPNPGCPPILARPHRPIQGSGGDRSTGHSLRTPKRTPGCAQLDKPFRDGTRALAGAKSFTGARCRRQGTEGGLP
jgi:hypothetical protein